MNVLLVGINAKYIHSNLAIHYLKEYVKEEHADVEIAEFTINQRTDYLLSEIYKKRPDILVFSAYIWNIELIKQLSIEYKKICKETMIVIGGPEVSYDTLEFLEENESVDCLIYGEGEEAFKQLLKCVKKKDMPLCDVRGLVFRDHGKVKKNLPSQPLDMDTLPFVYKDGFEAFENRILYYETTRGCPFNCQYCLSSIEKGVRYRSFEKVKEELQWFLDHKVMQVKFVDRTFNCKKSHAMAIWKYLHEHDNGYTNFHFEIAGALLDEETINFLSTVREGLFQFEIGIQTTNPKTLEVIERNNDFDKVKHVVTTLKKGQNIHLHLDLIAGLPEENYVSFGHSFDDVYRLKPEQLQLGFLKVLKGSGIHALCDTYAIKYRSYAPYEVLSTHVLSYDELEKLKMIEEMVEIYYNSQQYVNTITHLEKYFESPFKLYEKLAAYWEEQEYHKVNHSKLTLYTILKQFVELTVDEHKKYAIELLKFDMCLHEKVKKFPTWYETNRKQNKSIIAFYKEEENIHQYLPELKAYDSKQISRMAHIEVFDYDVLDEDLSIKEDVKPKQTPVLFNYYHRDKIYNHAKAIRINLD